MRHQIDFVNTPDLMQVLHQGSIFATKAKNPYLGGSGSVAFALDGGKFMSAGQKGLRIFDARQVLAWNQSKEGIAFTTTPAMVREFDASA